MTPATKLATPAWALIAAAILTSTAVHADERPETPKEVEATFESLDKDEDQRISKEEAASEKSLRKRFAAVDSNNDGTLSKEEYKARPSDEKFE